MDRRQVRPINELADIAGCQAGTLKKAFVGKRNINPLEPNYFYPGGSENVNHLNDPYGEKTNSMSAVNFKTAVNFGPKALKEEVAAGVDSEKSVKNSEAARSKQPSIRPQTAVAPPSHADSRKSIIQEAVMKRSQHTAS